MSESRYSRMRFGSAALAAQRVERKLAAILAVDIAGYSRLIRADEEGTRARLKAHRRELIDPKIAEHKGRILGPGPRAKTTGTCILAGFPSAVDAVRYAVEAQRAMVDRNAALPEDQRMSFRIGVISATSWLMVTTFMATALTSPRTCRPWRSRAASASRGWCAIGSATSSPTSSRTEASTASRMSNGRWVSTRSTLQ